MKFNLEEIGNRDDKGVWVKLGEFNFPEVESVEEATATYGEDVVLNLFNRALLNDQQRVAREACKKGEKSAEEIQKLITDYRPGIRTAKASFKNYTNLMSEVAAKGKVEVITAAISIYREDGLEAAYNYLVENR